MSDQLSPNQTKKEINQALTDEQLEENLLLGPAVNLSPPLKKHSPKTIKQNLYVKNLISEKILPFFGPSRYKENTEAEEKILQNKLEPMDLPLPIFAKFLNLKKEPKNDEILKNDDMEIDTIKTIESPKGKFSKQTLVI